MNCRLARLGIVLLLAMQPTGSAQESRFAIIVNNANPTSSVSLIELRRIFMKQTRTWSNGDLIVPVDWEATSDMRRSFSRNVLGRSVVEMTEFWIQQNYTQGLNPPPALKSARAILRFVASVPGAISYVPAGEVDDSVKVIGVAGLQ